MSIRIRTDLPFLDPNQQLESENVTANGSFCIGFTWKDACCLNLPFRFTVLVMSPHTLWNSLRTLNGASASRSGPGMGCLEFPNRAGVGNICAQYLFSAGSPNETFQQRFTSTARHWQTVLCLRSRAVSFSATETCWQTRLLSYYSLQYVAIKGRCAEKNIEDTIISSKKCLTTKIKSLQHCAETNVKPNKSTSVLNPGLYYMPETIINHLLSGFLKYQSTVIRHDLSTILTACV